MNAITQTEERQCSKKKHISTFTAKGDGSFYKTCDECREKNRVYRESEKGKAKRTEQFECECGSTVQRNHWARHLKSKPHHRWLNARENFVSVLVELLATHKQDLVVDRAIDYDDRCHGCMRNNDFCRCGDFYAADYDCY